MILEERDGGLVITWLPVEQMALLSLGLALTEEERRVLSALLEGRRVSLAEGALEYKQYASTGARQIMPIIARARLPMAMMPSSNFSPSPNRLPMMRSMAPRAIKRTIR